MDKKLQELKIGIKQLKKSLSIVEKLNNYWTILVGKQINIYNNHKKSPVFLNTDRVLQKSFVYGIIILLIDKVSI